MADQTPLRLRLLMGLTQCLEQIVPTGMTDSLEGKVFRGRALYGAGDPIPLLSILEAPTPADSYGVPLSSQAAFGAWELVIQGWTKDDKKNPTDPAHYLMADVKKALAAEKRKLIRTSTASPFGLGRAVTNFTISPGVVRPPDELSDKAYFWLSVMFDLVEDLDDPYA